MIKFTFFKALILLNLALSGYQLRSQTQLIVKLKNNTSETFEVSEIRSIKFLNNNMNLFRKNGSMSSWAISDIQDYSFNIQTGLENGSAISDDHFKIFPNPASEQVTFGFSSPVKQKIRIELIDLSGKVIRSIFEGNHYTDITYNWSVDVPKGFYLCRMISDAKSITKTFIVQ